ncbi:polysaccharide deacetylase [Blastococcus sp. Marseille-P5729]|uniref:polysaccharide deacetylase n=1 Tax=Blastococcus sp. Marseille-P5729 TaxID=2086582 RepID=UPI000D0EDCDF|nr:polysaccharide deacetylase [Blastococcus sp. Marseille-P5729]
MHQASSTMRSLWALLLVITLGLLAGCTGDDSSSGPASGSSSEGDSPDANDSAVIEQAKHQAAQYDYDAAIATLAGASSAEAKSALGEIESAKANAVQWADNTQIPHIFYHSLIVDPERAFNAPDGAGFNQYMVTVDEFKAQLQQIYANGWVLVHPERIAAPDANGQMVAQPIMLPPGKKPFILSLDDMSYYEYMSGKGFADNLFVAADGRVQNNYTDANGVTTQGSYDVVPILDDFVREHPDFSYRGDKGTIAMTGYNGLFGYRSSIQSYGDTPETQQAIADAKVVADAIKANGWHFAYHTWGHLNAGKVDMSWLTTDYKYWEQEVTPIIGETPIWIYAFGVDVGGDAPYDDGNAKYSYFHDKGYRYWFNVRAHDMAWVQIAGTNVRGARINIDGLTIQAVLDGYLPHVAEFFDVKSTIDPKRPLPVPQPGPEKAGGN